MDRNAFEGLAAQLGAVTERDQVPPIVLGYLSTLLDRVVLMAVRRTRLFGWDARGGGLRRQKVEKVSIPLHLASVFRTALESGAPFFGALPHDDVEETLLIKLDSESWPEEAVVIPVRVRDRPVALLYGEASRTQVARARDVAQVAGELLGDTFVRLLVAKRAARENTVDTVDT